MLKFKKFIKFYSLPITSSTNNKISKKKIFFHLKICILLVKIVLKYFILKPTASFECYQSTE